MEPSEDTLLRSQAAEAAGGHLAAIVESSDDAIIGEDLDSLIRSWNKGAQSLFGYTAREAVGQSITILIPPDHAEEEPEILGRIKRGAQVSHYEAIRLRKDGRRGAISLTVFPIRDARGTIVGASEIARDVSGRKEAAQAARHLAAIVESSDDAIIGKTLDGIIVSWNPGAERLYQYTAEEIVGRRIDVLVPPDHPDELPTIMARLRRGERVEHYETQRVRKDGKRLHVSVTISPVRDATGAVIGASAIARDISERVRLERERERLLEDEREIHAATQRARREADEANRAKDEFLAMVSHELRTPLHAVTGWLHVLRAKRDDRYPRAGVPHPHRRGMGGAAERRRRRVRAHLHGGPGVRRSAGAPGEPRARGQQCRVGAAQGLGASVDALAYPGRGAARRAHDR